MFYPDPPPKNSEGGKKPVYGNTEKNVANRRCPVLRIFNTDGEKLQYLAMYCLNKIILGEEKKKAC
jgi:hypothetical protein